ncbi:hypothetical protein GGF50DRAFT_66318 [Schizophyllum commune]
MTTPGEQQFYAVALMDALMEQLPPTWTVGLLYDIACTIHHSAVKHGYFAKYLDRLHFAVSVFHAFGHDWPCQLIYHPRKCVGFGLTDGEGCERFWYSISRLIPYLRVAGFHLRQYTLNGQFAFATKGAIGAMGAWLNRKEVNLSQKRDEALALLEEAGEIGRDEEFIRGQWADQALELYDEVARAQDEMNCAEAAAESADSGDAQDLDREAELRRAQATYLATKARYERKVAKLGVAGNAELRKLLNNKLLHRRANALVLLSRAQKGIMKRKLEVERVVRSHRNKNGENRLQKHIKTAAERREGTVKTIVKKYNKACRELSSLIQAQRTRTGRCPIRPLKELPATGLWDLGIDNPCWDDLRYDADDEDAAPPWMANEDVRKAIRGRLLLDRCQEEERRLQHERENVLEWLEVEWVAVLRAMNASLGVPDAAALLHQLVDRRRELLRIAVHWQRYLPGVRGPSAMEMMVARHDWENASCDARRTRSGAIFSNIIAVPGHIDLEELFKSAEENQADECGPESDIESDNESELTPPPSSRAPSPLSELSELTESEDESEAADGAPPPPATGKNSKARKSKAHRKRKREERGNDSEASKRHRAGKILDALHIPASFDFSKAPITRTGFTCLRNAAEVDIPAFEELKDFTYVDWDGRDSGALAVNEEQVILGMLIGGGKGGWKKGHHQLADAMESAATRMTFSAEECQHRRGDFCVKAIGTSHGGGQKEPALLKHSKKNMKELVAITKLKPMKRIAQHSSRAFGNWQPEIYEDYADVQERLFKWNPLLRRRRNFKKSVWSCLTLNFGPRTETAPHRDFGNRSCGFCAITSLGRFNPDKGGHLILRELKLVIRFPPGSTIIIPSALITHYNTRIAEDETRFSVTQYTSGAIFRFVEHGCMLNKDYYASLDAEGRKKSDEVDAARWKKGLAKLSRLPQLRREAQRVKAGVHEKGAVN